MAWNLNVKRLNLLKETLSSRAEQGVAVLSQFSGQLSQYEIRARALAKDLDLRSQVARKRSEAKLEEFLKHLRKTRAQLEKNVTAMVQIERKKLNGKVHELLTTLKKLAGQQKSVKKATKIRKGKIKRKTTKRKTAASAFSQP